MVNRFIYFMGWRCIQDNFCFFIETVLLRHPFDGYLYSYISNKPPKQEAACPGTGSCCFCVFLGIHLVDIFFVLCSLLAPNSRRYAPSGYKRGNSSRVSGCYGGQNHQMPNPPFGDADPKVWRNARTACPDGFSGSGAYHPGALTGRGVGPLLRYTVIYQDKYCVSLFLSED